jgi:hypothetical protein
MVEKSVPGSITRFSKASGVLHWLLGETPTKVVPWVYRPVSSVRYLRVTYDLMPRSIRFSTGKPEVSLIPTARNSPSNVDLSSQKANPPPCNGNKSGICGRCRRYGLPRCPYTPNVPTQSEVLEGTVSRDQVAALRSRSCTTELLQPKEKLPLRTLSSSMKLAESLLATWILAAELKDTAALSDSTML